MQINISRKTLIVLAVLLITLVTGGSLLSACAGNAVASDYQSSNTQPKAIQASADLTDPAQAAMHFMQAYYTADYRHRDQWLAAVKPLASADGYTLLENMIAPALWPDLEKAQTVIAADQVRVEDRGLKAEGVSKLMNNTPWQIRGVAITLAAGAKWPGLTTNTYATNVLLSQENGTWKFVMLMSDDQIKMFQAKGAK
jgi:hypothetical protein